MAFLPYLCLGAFLISLPLRWWQNTWIGASAFDTPLIVRRALPQLAFLSFTFVITYGGIAGIWYFYGFWPAGLLAFSLRWWVGSTSWKRQFNFEVGRCANHYYRQMLQAKAQQRTPKQLGLSPELPEDIATWDDETMKRQAYLIGKNTAREMRLKRR